jgi:hypothetical protein
MRRQCAKATDQWAQRVAGRPNSLAGRPHFSYSHGLLHGHALQEAVTRNPKLEVCGSRTRWPPDHVARPTDQHLACYRLNQVGNFPLHPYKYPPADGIQDTTLYL